MFQAANKEDFSDAKTLHTFVNIVFLKYVAAITAGTGIGAI